jgi:hypothetical protein
VFGQGGGVTRAMQHANDYQFAFIVTVVDDIVAGKTGAQAGRKLLARSAGKRKVTERLALPP